MLFFKKRGKTRAGQNDMSPRTRRMWLRRIKLGTVALALAGALTAGVVHAWQQGIIGAFGLWAHDRAMTYTVNAGFAVGDVLVTGRRNIPQEEILQALDIHRGAPLLGVDARAAQERLQQLPWVETASVGRRLPDKIVVNLTERQPAAIWQYRKKLSLIDKNGHVLGDREMAAFGHLPLVVGEDAPAHVGDVLQLLAAEQGIAARADSWVRVGNRRWDLHLKGGTVVRLPESNIELALSRLARAGAAIAAGDITTIDLRIPEKMVVTQKAPPQEKKI